MGYLMIQFTGDRQTLKKEENLPFGILNLLKA